MKQKLKRYIPTLFTLLLVALGAAMPWLAALGQDARIGKLREELELDTVSLTLLENNGVEQALRIASSEYVQLPWTGGTALTEEQAVRAALETLEQMREFGLACDDDMYFYILKGTEGTVEPCLMVAEDGSSALVWNCRWENEAPYQVAVTDGTGKYAEAALSVVSTYYEVTIDDASGKAARLSVSGPPWGDAAFGIDAENYYLLLRQWMDFLTAYYGSDHVYAQLSRPFEEGEGLAALEIFPDRTQSLTLPLEMTYDGGVRFNMAGA